MSDTPRQPSSSKEPASNPSAPPDAATSPSPPRRSQADRANAASGWAGWVVFAAVMMIVIGAFQVIQGLVALFRDTYYLVTSSGLLVDVDYTAWGWVHLVLGLIVFAAGIGVLYGAFWGRVIGVALASISALVNLGFLAAFPLWSALMIALDVVVIFALTVHGSEVAES